MGAVVAGMVAGTKVLAQDKKPEDKEKHVCKGHNSCKGNGGCKSGDAGCAGQELVQGQGWLRDRREARLQGPERLQGAGRLQVGRRRLRRARTPARARAAARCPSSPKGLRHRPGPEPRRGCRGSGRFRLRSMTLQAPQALRPSRTSASASVCAPSTTATSSSTGRRSTGSRSSPRTSSTPGAGPPGCSTRWPSAIRWSCTACRCPSAAPTRSTATTSSKLKALADRTRAHWVSDHLCWTGVMGRNTHDLLPMPYTEEALAPHRRAREAGERDPRAAPRAREPVLLRGVRRLDPDRVGVPAPARGGGRLRACSST